MKQTGTPDVDSAFARSVLRVPRCLTWLPQSSSTLKDFPAEKERVLAKGKNSKRLL